jgi:ATP-dependent Lon protease
MNIDNNAVYSISEASAVSEIPKRTLQNYCKRDKIKHQDNIYIIKGSVLSKWIEVRLKSALKRDGVRVSALSGAVDGAVNKQLYLQVQALELEIEKLKEERTEKPTNEIQEIIQEINNDTYVLELLKAIKEDKHLEEFSEEEYEQFKNRLVEANYLENRISEFKKEIARMEDYVLDYRSNIEYLKKSLDKRADETAILLKSIEQRNYIEAKEKKLD